MKTQRRIKRSRSKRIRRSRRTRRTKRGGRKKRNSRKRRVSKKIGGMGKKCSDNEGEVACNAHTLGTIKQCSWKEPDEGKAFCKPKFGVTYPGDSVMEGFGHAAELTARGWAALSD